MYAPLDINHAVKTQTIRVADVFVIGPMMVWGGAALGRTGHPVAGLILAAMGVGTVVFNGVNWFRVQAQLDAARTEPR